MPEKMQMSFDEIRKYNTWDGDSQHAGYVRKEYLDSITGYIGNKLIKVLVGQRRTGKSYILRQIIHFLMTEKGVNPGNIFYLNMEFTAFHDVKTASDLENLFKIYQKQIMPTGKIYIFLDEVQNIEKWESFVNPHCRPNTLFC